MGEYDISQWRLAGTLIHTPSDPKMATGVRTGFSCWKKANHSPDPLKNMTKVTDV